MEEGGDELASNHRIMKIPGGQQLYYVMPLAKLHYKFEVSYLYIAHFVLGIDISPIYYWMDVGFSLNRATHLSNSR